MRYCESCRAAFQALRTCPRDKQATRPDLSDPLLGHVLGDRYRILERIASGGMGQVYRAAHARIACLFAVKVLYGDIAYDAEIRARFQKEAEVASCLQSRYIVRVVDFSESSEGLSYIVMEHLAGAALDRVIAEKGAFDPARAVSIALQVARGLAHAHERGVVHRDMKPANVMLVREDDEDDVARLLDFGIARIGEAGNLTRAGVVMGTPEYMAPEQFLGSDVDARADLYSLGVMLYEMLTGDIPFESESLAKFAEKHQREAPAPLSMRKTRGAVPPALESVMMRLLRKSRDERYGSAREVVEALLAVSRSPEAPRSTAPSRKSLVPEAIAGAQAAEKIREAVRLGAPMYNVGDHAGCAALYRQTVDALLADGLREETRQAAAARLTVGAARAARSAEATRAAWELRWALDDMLLVVTSTGDALETELLAARTMSAPRYAARETELVAQFYSAFAVALSRALKEADPKSPVAAALEAALGKARETPGPDGALLHVGRALDGLQTGREAQTERPRVRLHVTCPSAHAFAAQISRAIAEGAPAYNAGDVEGCCRIYRETAEEIVANVAHHPGCADVASLLGAALEEGKKLDASRAAWALRHAFDEILGRV